MKRHATNPVNDRKIYRRTANRTRRINVVPMNTRGGGRM